MYIRTIKRKNKDGSVVEYVQLANNVWNKEKGFAQAQASILLAAAISSMLKRLSG